MPSIIEGYNYDIFISYRQKDNKHDGWVTEFVNNLKGELESTFKEEISVYFDINPHDGLLETYDVDESLKEKLKCLIFIPIISRTYCDPKSFAWEHEFIAFVEQASKDQFGLKVKLLNGNVASRVLPIIIYDLDKHDIKLCESLLGGVLRGAEFIYKSAGVNRPLRANEDHPHDNINNTYYRDQVNKVANTIKDVMNSLTANEPSVVETITERTSSDRLISTKRPLKKNQLEIPAISFLNRLKKLTTLNLKAWRIIALILFIVSIGSIWLHFRQKLSPSDRIEMRFDIPLTQDLERIGRRALAISPKAEYLVYCMNNELNLSQINSDVPSEPIPGTKSSDQPFFSPDSKWIGFFNFRERKIMKVSIGGGNPIPICDLAEYMNEANWCENEIIFAVGSNIYSVPDIGGKPELLYPLVKPENNLIIWNPQLLPDKKTLLFSQEQVDGGWSILTWKLGSKENPVVLVERGKSGRFLKTGHLLYSFNNQLYISKFNAKINRIVSDPQVIQTNPVLEETFNFDFGQSQFDFSENGIIVYYEAQSANLKKLVWVNVFGKVTPVTDETKNYAISAISPDGENIAVSFNTDKVAYNFGGDEETENCQIDIINIKTGNSTLFIKNANWPVWSADGTSIFYVTGNQVYQKPLDPGESSTFLFKVDSVEYVQTHDLSLDGRYLPFTIGTWGRGSAIGFYDITNRKLKILDYFDFPPRWVFYPAISPDGKWVAFLSNFEGYVAVYVAPFQGSGQMIKVSLPARSNETNFPVWSPDMTALYYRTYIPDYEIWKVKVGVSKDQFSYEPPQAIFNGGHRFPKTTNTANVEIHPNGDRFLLMQLISDNQEEVITPRIKVVINWESELEDK